MIVARAALEGSGDSTKRSGHSESPSWSQAAVDLLEVTDVTGEAG
jgi:hypothetical protein